MALSAARGFRFTVYCSRFSVPGNLSWIEEVIYSNFVPRNIQKVWEHAQTHIQVLAQLLHLWFYAFLHFLHTFLGFGHLLFWRRKENNSSVGKNLQRLEQVSESSVHLVHLFLFPLTQGLISASRFLGEGQNNISSFPVLCFSVNSSTGTMNCGCFTNAHNQVNVGAGTSDNIHRFYCEMFHKLPVSYN